MKTNIPIKNMLNPRTYRTIAIVDNETPVSLPKFISAQKLLEDKFVLEFSYNDI